MLACATGIARAIQVTDDHLSARKIELGVMTKRRATTKFSDEI